MGSLDPLGAIFPREDIVKVVHNAPFERCILGEVGLELRGVFDSLKAVRHICGGKIKGGFGLASVCRRELGIELDKGEQSSDWSRRPLSES